MFKLRELQNISLKWKLMIPFLFMPAALTVALVGWGVGSQLQIIRDREKRVMMSDYLDFSRNIALHLDLVKANASVAAANPYVQKALFNADREQLSNVYAPLFEKLKKDIGITLLHFHLFPATSFLRLHDPQRFGDEMISYRETIKDAYNTGESTAGLEYGLNGFGLRGVAPVFYEGRLVGSVEAGFLLNQTFLNRMKDTLDADLTIYMPAPDETPPFRVMASTAPTNTMLDYGVYQRALVQGEPAFFTLARSKADLAVLVSRLKDYKGDAVALIEITRDRSSTLALIKRHAYMILGFGLLVLAFAMIFVWWISREFLKPINGLAAQAERIRAGEIVPQVQVQNRDEFGSLAEAINRMLAKLEASRYQLENYAQELEQKFHDRTVELVESEEKFRTLMENIPLVVYRLEPGLIRSFVSSYIEELTGWPPEELVGGPAVWSATIHPADRRRVVETKKQCIEKGRIFEMEYRFQDSKGQDVDILDHAVPILDKSGELLYMEGYMQDIRERRRLQEHTVKSEELKTLTDISARLAHEFRNPLSVVGLSARRLAGKLSESDNAYAYVEMIIEQVEHLEQIINMIQTYIKPIGVKLKSVDLKSFINKQINLCMDILNEKDIDVIREIPDDGVPVLLDAVLMERALTNIIRNAVYQMPSRGVLKVSIAQTNKQVEMKIVYPAGYLPDDRLRQFFYPFTTEESNMEIVDLPLVPVIIHKHNGVITVGRENEDLISVEITLPI